MMRKRLAQRPSWRFSWPVLPGLAWLLILSTLVVAGNGAAVDEQQWDEEHVKDTDDENENSRDNNVQRKTLLLNPPPPYDSRPCAPNDKGTMQTNVLVVIDERKPFVTSVEKADYERAFKDVYNELVLQTCDDPFFRQIVSISLISPLSRRRLTKETDENEKDEQQLQHEQSRELFQTAPNSLGPTGLIFQITLACHQNCSLEVGKKTAFGRSAPAPTARYRRRRLSFANDETASTMNNGDGSVVPSSSAVQRRQLQMTPPAPTPFMPTQPPTTPRPTPDIPISSTCGSLSSRQINYRGTISRTVQGKTCQRWDSNVPHIHEFYSIANFPNAGLEENYCRNPGSAEPRSWCYTTDPMDRFDFCNVPDCDVALAPSTQVPTGIPVITSSPIVLPTPQPSLSPLVPPWGSQLECKCPQNFVGQSRPPNEGEFAGCYQDALLGTSVSQVVELKLAKSKPGGIQSSSSQRLVYLELRIDAALTRLTNTDQADMMQLFEETFNQQAFLNCDSSFRRLRDPFAREELPQTVSVPYQMILEFTIDSDGPSSSVLEPSGNRRLEGNEKKEDTTKEKRPNFSRGLQIDNPNGFYCPRHLPTSGRGPSRQQMVALLTENLDWVKTNHVELSTVSSILSVTEVIELPCLEPLNTLASTVEMVLDFSAAPLTPAETDLFVQIFVNAYNNLTIENCDEKVRKIESADFSFEGNTLIFDPTFSCRCVAGTLLLTPATGRNRELVLQKPHENDSDHDTFPQEGIPKRRSRQSTRRRLQLSDFTGCYCPAGPGKSQTSPTGAELQNEISMEIVARQSSGALPNFSGNIVDTYEVISEMPTIDPSVVPSVIPSSLPTFFPSLDPSTTPLPTTTCMPSPTPTFTPTTAIPSFLPSGCTLPINTFESITLIYVDFDLQLLTTAEIQVLESAFAGVYNSLSSENCDSFGRKVMDVRIVIDDAITLPTKRERRLGFGTGGRFAATSTIKCSCPSSSTAFSGRFGRRELEERVNQTLALDRKLQTPNPNCPIGAGGTGTAPTEDEFLSQYQMAIESIQNETSLLGGFGEITSLHEVADLNCTLPFITFERTVLIDYDFDNETLTQDDIETLERLYVDVYNVLSLNNCDKSGRRISDVSFAATNDLLPGVRGRERRLAFGKSGRFTVKSKIQCSCPKSSTAFTGRFGRRSLGERANEDARSLVWDRKLQAADLGCYCPVRTVGTGEAPTEAEFIVQYQAAIESVKNETGQLAGLIKITALAEVTPVNFSSPFTTHDTVIAIAAFETKNLTDADISALERAIADVYDRLAFDNCDHLGRRVVNVTVSVNDAYLGAPFFISNDVHVSTIVAYVRFGCFCLNDTVALFAPPSDERRQDMDGDGNIGAPPPALNRNLQESGVPQDDVYFCPAHGQGTGTAPLNTEFRYALNEAIRVIGSETDLLGDFGPIASIEEIKQYNCSSRGLCHTTIKALLEGDASQVTDAEKVILEDAFLASFNVLSFNLCDPLGRAALMTGLRVLPDVADDDGYFNAEFFVQFSTHPNELNTCQNPPCSNECALFQQEAPRKKRGLATENTASSIKSSLPSFSLIVGGKHDQNGRNLQTTDDSTNKMAATTFSICSCAAFGKGFSSRRLSTMVQQQAATAVGSEGFLEPTLSLFTQEYSRAVAALAEEGVLVNVVNAQVGLQRDDIIPPDTCRCQAKGEVLYGDTTRPRLSDKSKIGKKGGGSYGGVWRRSRKRHANHPQRTKHKAMNARVLTNRKGYITVDGVTVIPNNKYPCYLSQAQFDKKFGPASRDSGRSSPSEFEVVPDTTGGGVWWQNYGQRQRDLHLHDQTSDESLEHHAGNNNASSESRALMLDHSDADDNDSSNNNVKARSLSMGSGMSSMKSTRAMSMSKSNTSSMSRPAIMTMMYMKKWFKVMQGGERMGTKGKGHVMNIFKGVARKKMKRHYKKRKKHMKMHMEGLFRCPDYV